MFADWKETSQMTVNLDAMIEREEFESDLGAQPDQGRPGTELYLNALTEGGRLAAIRKPDFQRETSAWKPDIIAKFITSVADGDVIPALIMWRSPTTGKVFVIDGAHRLSALIAWIIDDYGDKKKSQDFFNYQIDPAQRKAAKSTRDLIEASVGRYEDLRAYASDPSRAPSDRARKRSLRIVNDPIYLQWVVGDASAAEASFVRINSTAVSIDDTEKALISARKKPNGISSRALLRAGTGHEYWAKFQKQNRVAIQTLSQDIHEQIIKPIVEFPMDVLNMPVATRGYSANSVKTIFDLVSFINPDEGVDDETGDKTLKCLRKVKSSTERVFGKHSGSLALHPGIYCYGSNGKFILKAFIGAVGFVDKLIERNKFFEFTKNRSAFEEFLNSRRHYIHQIGRAQGSGGRRGIPALIRLYSLVFEKISEGCSESDVVSAIMADDALKFLSEDKTSEVGSTRTFPKETRAAAMLRDILTTEMRCSECGARVYKKVLSADHVVRVEDGGRSTVENLSWNHPYCNSGYKERIHHLSKSKST